MTLAMAREHVHGVLDVHAVDLQMRRISDYPVDRADEPLAGVEQVRQGVLHRAAAGGPMRIVGTAIGRPIEREVLPRDRDELERFAETAGCQRIAHLRERRLRPHHVADGGHNPFPGSEVNEFIDTVQAHAEWLLDEYVDAAFDKLDRLRDVQRGRGCDDGGVGSVLDRVFERRVRGRLPISRRDRRAQLGVHLEEGNPPRAVARRHRK